MFEVTLDVKLEVRLDSTVDPITWLKLLPIDESWLAFPGISGTGGVLSPLLPSEPM